MRLVLLATILSTTIILILQTKLSQQKKRRPPGPWRLPIIGNLHQMLSGNQLPHRRLRELATIYGPLMHLQLGEVQTVVVSSAELAREFLHTKDLNFANRPYLPSVHTIFYQGRGLAFANGEYWKRMRKICVRELLGANRVKSLIPTIKEEVSELHQQQPLSSSSSAINIGGMIVSLGNSVISRTAFGKIQKHSDSFHPVQSKIIKAIGGSSLWDLFPSSYLVRLLTTTESKLNKIHKRADAILQIIIDDHIAKGSRETDNIVKKTDEDLVDQDLEVPFTNNDIKAVLLDIFLGGGETSPVVIEWALSKLMRNSQAMEKVQKEIRDHFDEKGRIDYGDLDQLHYLKLIIKETLRLHSPGPLLAPREAGEAMVIHGYHIPAKTRIVINAYAIARDPRIWHEPDNFFPERFLDDLSSNTDYSKGLDFSLIAFGSGRRICPGIQLGMALVSLCLANLLYYFDWKLPPSITFQTLDMSEEFGITVKRKKELYLIPIPYHPKTL
ncbi:Desmethyl-deoxy-podophyllotoxin synthase [Linum grandiflorum]